MLYALGSLSRAENVPAETLEAVEALSENMFSGDHPAMEMRYRDLPSDFIKELENITYFHSPFSAFEVMEKLERAD
ncbi:hypothetical protein SAMN05216203_1451 [Marinobacter daqiaonensis]|uniref:Uncharacterized protein n=1 Tax=Marinobacter daqiaonensis TaxID=650891 RepID=A0A1I6HRJ3_9GAMM|nr:hypothetical protein [Marinobacter daqiaonensis]SFR57076.1 hypothetical protein SAMN05216203_1451 [Marinobacter daqiaonensis]